MGTYLTLQLEDTSESRIKKINKELRELGYIAEEPYGAFNTRESVQAEADFMNNDPEGLKQVPDIQRPITVEILQGLVHWYRIGYCEYKLSCMEETEAHNINILAKYFQHKPDLLDVEKSDNYNMKTVRQYTGYSIINNSQDDNEGIYRKEDEPQLKTIVIRLNSGIAEVDMSTIPEGIEVEIRDYDIDGAEEDELFNDETGVYIQNCFIKEDK